MYPVSVMYKHHIVYCSISHVLYSFQIALTSLVGDYSRGKRPLSSTHGSGKSHRIRRSGRPAPGHTGKHGLINYIETKEKMSSLIKFICTGTLRQVFLRVYRLEKQSSHIGVFDPAL